MKKQILFLVGACFGSASLGQTPESSKTLLDTDSLSAVIEISERSQTFQVPGEERLRLRADLALNFCAYMNQRHGATVRPHLFLRLRGHTAPNYYSIQGGFGYTHRSDRYAIGFFVGKYERAVRYGGDIVFRNNKEYESRPLMGGYVHFDPKGVIFFGSLSQERKRVCHFAHIGCKVADLVILPKAFRGLRISAESEYLVGTSFGLSLRYPHVSFGFSYHLPKEQEETYQKSAALKIQGGYSLTWSYRWF